MKNGLQQTEIVGKGRRVAGILQLSEHFVVGETLRRKRRGQREQVPQKRRLDFFFYNWSTSRARTVSIKETGASPSPAGRSSFSLPAGDRSHLEDGLPLLEFLDQQRHQGSFEITHIRSVNGSLYKYDIYYSTVE